MNPRRARLPPLHAGIAGFIFLCFFATSFVGILGTSWEFTPCRCTIESTVTRYARHFYPVDSRCTIDAVSTCLCEGNRVSEPAMIVSSCETAGIVLNATKGAFHFRATIIYSGYTWDNDPPESFAQLFFGLITLGVSLILFSVVAFYLVVKYDRRHPKEVEEEVREGEEQIQAA